MFQKYHLPLTLILAAVALLACYKIDSSNCYWPTSYPDQITETVTKYRDASPE